MAHGSPKHIKPHIAAAARALVEQHGTYRKAGEAIGFSYAILNHIANGRANEVAPETVLEFARIVKAEPPARNPIRLTVPDDLADAVQAARAQGRSTRDILTRGLGNG